MSSAEDTRKILEHWQSAAPNDRLAHLVKDATRAFVRALQMRLNEHHVSFGHWAFLRILWERDGLTQRELSDEAGVMEPTTYSALKAMEALGYVERKHLPGNKKNMYVYLTDRGRALERKLIPLAEEVNRIGIGGLTEDQIDVARKVLLGIIANLAEDEEKAEARSLRIPSTRELSRRVSERVERQRARAPRREAEAGTQAAAPRKKRVAAHDE
ncbi:MarR family transcriptional regulator [Pigmentiphaga sp.]|uniref:MarR family winged helix-turn-helix transcriptional regulator n=1 Tax=Pigmentiphaga sp. TaxID=1977564 RepID=UPI00128B5D2C|nr:MarR family transcriptional regulator [Pigmentiphaga sp.]MPS25360.1 MarR family transcriptional regulator [Alcaligenaceae bacterium SAGV5]MPS53974.1 MarR family transcriptional regulator [Alcaligenaceae bacterium SAGV3]MPT59333.1 MarR family transcriptional regulator [Alcaligenaceae bacterium]